MGASASAASEFWSLCKLSFGVHARCSIPSVLWGSVFISCSAARILPGRQRSQRGQRGSLGMLLHSQRRAHRWGLISPQSFDQSLLKCVRACVCERREDHSSDLTSTKWWNKQEQSWEVWKHLVGQQLNFLTWGIQMSLNSGRLFTSCRITRPLEHCFLAASLLE